MATHWATDSPSATIPGVQSFETLPAEGVRTVQQFGSVEVQVEVVVADFALVFIVRLSRAMVASCVNRLRHVPSNWAAALFDFDQIS